MNNIQAMINKNAKGDQYRVGPVQFHKHNGIDSPRLFPQNLGMLSGGVTLVGGAARINDSRIHPYPKSTIQLTTSDSHSPAEALWGECFQGYATIGSNAATDRINYLIILNP